MTGEKQLNPWTIEVLGFYPSYFSDYSLPYGSGIQETFTCGRQALSAPVQGSYAQGRPLAAVYPPAARASHALQDSRL